MADATDDTPFQSLYRRFRPSTFAAVRGQDHVVLALRNAVRDERVAHAYLFSGPRGTGKTSTARILAKALNCTDLHEGEPCGVCASCVEIGRGASLDVHELDAASNNGVEAMRDLVSRAALGTPGRQKVYIVDEVHMLSTAASNALLKTLEEPPAHVIFVLATTDPQKVLPTIRSRTQHFEFRLLGPETLGELLAQVREDAHLDVPDEALDLAVRRGRGSARDALSVLDQVVASDSVDDDLPELDEVVEGLADRDVARSLVAVAHLTSAGFSPQQLAGDLVDYLRQGFLSLVAPDLVAVSGTEQQALSVRAGRVGLAALVRAMEVLGQAQVSMRDAPDPRVNLEVALVRLAHPEADASPEALLARIERLEAGDRTVGNVAVPPSAAVPSAAVTSTMHLPPTLAADETVPSPSGPPKKTLGALRRQSAPVPNEQTAPDAAPSPHLAAPPTAAVTAADPANLDPAAAALDPTADPGAGLPTPAAPGASPSTPGTFPSRDQLVQAWGDHIIGRLRPKAKALYQAGRFVGVEDDRAVFGLPNETHRARCEEVRREIETVLSDHFGRPVGLTLVVDGQVDSAIASPTDTRSHDRSTDRRPNERPSTTGASSSGRPSSDSVGTTGLPSAQGPSKGPDDSSDDVPPDIDLDDDDLSAFDESQLGEVANVDNSAQARVLQAFPGAEEVN